MKRTLLLSIISTLLISLCGCSPAVNSGTGSQSISSDTENTTDIPTDADFNTKSTDESILSTTPDDNVQAEATSSETSKSKVKEEDDSKKAPIPECHLYELFAKYNIKAGTCLSEKMIKNPDASELITNQFNSITMENAMKPDYIFNRSKSIEAGNLVVEFGRDAINMLDWAKANNMSVRGHTLIWHQQTPDWIFYEDFDMSKDLVSREVMLDRMDTYIAQVFAFLEENNYSELFYAYDIVNEAIEDNGKLRQSNWLNTIGDDYLWHAFNYANMYAPENIDLYYNDYNEQYKAAHIVKIMDTMRDEDGNYLLDGIGLQAHLYTADDIRKYMQCVDKLATTGLKLEITELDVGLGAWNKGIEANEDNFKLQGRYYYDFINNILEKAESGKINLDTITFWGFADNMSWRRDNYPLLYNDRLEPKYSYYGAMQIKDMAGFEE